MATKDNKNTPHDHLPSYQEAAADPPPNFYSIYPTERDIVEAKYIYIAAFFCTTCGRFHRVRAHAPPEDSSMPPDYRQANEGDLFKNDLGDDLSEHDSNDDASEDDSGIDEYIADTLFQLDYAIHEAYVRVSSECCQADRATKKKIYAHINSLDVLARQIMTAPGAGTFTVDDALETTVAALQDVAQIVIQDCHDEEMERHVVSQLDFINDFLTWPRWESHPEPDDADD